MLFNSTGPTSFAPIIEMAMTVVESSGGQYHVLLIIADGQVYTYTHTHLSYISNDSIIHVMICKNAPS